MNNFIRVFSIHIVLILSLLSLTTSTKAQTYINELMASNHFALFDDFFESDDWLELYHEGGVLNLEGHYLSDRSDNLTKWQFPSTNAGLTTILPNGFLLVWLDNDSIQGENHAEFKLSPDGEGVYLTAPDGLTVLDSVIFPMQQSDISYGRVCDGCDDWIYFNVPTPEATNVSGEVPTPLLYINEVLHSNLDNLIDENFEADSWLELYNPNSFQVNLAGYTFSNDAGLSYVVPSDFPWETTIEAEGWLLFWMDGDLDQGGHHLGFEPSIMSSDVTLTGPDGIVADSYIYQVGYSNVSWGRMTDGSPANQWFNTPTPRVSNTLLIIPPADLSINEVQTTNLTDTIDASGVIGPVEIFGAHEDWLEIVNNSDSPVDLAGYYLTDRLNQPMKWQFPLGIPDSTIIAPGEYKLIWADEDGGQGWNHTNFKFSSLGEVVVLRSVDGFSIADSVHFGAIPSDHSWGRDIDGVGPWRTFLPGATTPESCNVCTSSISPTQPRNPHVLSAFPNPLRSGESLTISTPSILLDLNSRVIARFPNHGPQVINLASGVYFLRPTEPSYATTGTQKIVVLE
ncbi:MAG TPA: lamin tail domain-containing protein [Flavobacteriales bacterium]|nr:lamin tail domain-containing protein [Flavobacteriales bacterium]HIB76050.1 lamin tail domain-containing protein [Flavobacteriales bacterium]